MSAFLLGTGFRADMGTCIRKLVLLKLIDACEDDGTRIFPAMATVAKAAQCSVRQVQREIGAFVEIGLLRLVREGGKGRRSTNEYALDLAVLSAICRDGWDAYAENGGTSSKGDTVSPLDDEVKGDSGDALRVTGETVKGDNVCHTTPPEPSTDPSEEREARARDLPETDDQPIASGDDPAKFEKRVKRLAADLDWPGWANSSTAWTVAQFAKLTDAERAEAEARAPQYRSTTGSKALSLGTYFAERKWTALPEPADETPTTIEAKPFGPLWGAAVLRELLSPPLPPPRPSSAFLVDLLSRQDAKGHAERMRRQAEFGWPKVKGWYEQADSRKGFSLPYEDRGLGELMEPVPVESEMFAAWRTEFERRGWPWIPDPGRMPVVNFPMGGPAGLAAFEAAVRGEGEAMGEAAE